MTDWTPPPPGSTAEQLPDHILAVIHTAPYLSTACQTAQACTDAAAVGINQLERPELHAHADRLHARCRLNNKFTGQLCICPCHETGATGGEL